MAAPTFMIVTGEASGDLHAAELLHQLKKQAPGCTAFGMGGARCIAEGLEALADAKDISVMGITDVVPALPRILRAMRLLEAAARARRPTVAILVDMPDFNLRLAKALKRLGIPVAYYVSPTVWAWRAGRVETVRRYVDRMMCILPFEEAFYRKQGVTTARYVGSPVLDEHREPPPLPALRASLGMRVAGPALALLPGSRMGEIRRILPAMLDAAAALRATRPALELVLPVAPTIPRSVIEAECNKRNLRPVLVEGRAPEVVAACDAAIVASGTAVLEAALTLRPLVVVYRVSAVTWWVGRALVKVAHVALVNLLAGREVVPELLQAQMSAGRIAREVGRLLDEPATRERQVAGLAEVRGKLGEKGASERAAQVVLELVR